MCGRYRLKDPKRAFDWLEVVPSFDMHPRFNIAPAQRVPVVTGAGHIEEMTWGLDPVWAREKSKLLINARSETVREKRSLKASFAQRRCLVPADGFYEWSKVGKRPHLFTVGRDAPFAIAGIWETAGEVPRCCLLTTAANSVLAPVHDRMPVIVSREDWVEWFSPGELAERSFQRIMAPYRPDAMFVAAVSPLVNSARIDDPGCCEAEHPPAQQTFGF